MESATGKLPRHIESNSYGGDNAGDRLETGADRRIRKQRHGTKTKGKHRRIRRCTESYSIAHIIGHKKPVTHTGQPGKGAG